MESSSPSPLFPLRWESTGDQWWYATPIDWAAANGHLDVVRELLRVDANLLIKLTSLRRLRRLETVWDDNFSSAPLGRCTIAKALLFEFESKHSPNALIRAGYGGWLLYTAASAGDLDFAKELLRREPRLVFGEGEYGITDIFYAASRSKNSEVFRLLLEFAINPRSWGTEDVEEGQGQINGVSPLFRSEIMNRAVHAAARGGNFEMLKELLNDLPDPLVYRDLQGSTLLHAAAGRGQTEVVKYLIGSFNIIASRDNEGNTALHLAAFRGHLAVVEELVCASPSLPTLTNNARETFLHMAVAGFRAPGFHRLDRQIELIEHLISETNLFHLPDIINCKNAEGKTVLHMAVSGNILTNLVELIMSVRGIDLNIHDSNGMTPLDVLNLHPRSPSSELLIRQLILAGGIGNSKDYAMRSAIVSHLKMQALGSRSPGTSFRISDGEIFLYTGTENPSELYERGSARPSSCSNSSRPSEISLLESNGATHGSASTKRSTPVNSAARRLRILLGWSHGKERIRDKAKKSLKFRDDDSSLDSFGKCSPEENIPTPLRLRFSKPPSLPNNKRTLSVRSALPSPMTKKKFASGLTHGVLQAMPHLVFQSSPSSLSRTPMLSSPPSSDKTQGLTSDSERTPSTAPAASSATTITTTMFASKDGKEDSGRKSTHGLMNHYFCFGAHGLSYDDESQMVGGHRANRFYKRSILSEA